MPEEPIETQELQEKLNEAIERAEEAGEERAFPSWTLRLALSTAMIAVLAAIASLQAGSLANQAILLKNNAVLYQSKASDGWAYYQAKGIKALIYQTQSESLAGRPALSGKFAEEAKRYKDEQELLKKEADELENKVLENNTEAGHLMHHHHQFALAVTLFQVSIALAAIASLTRRRAMWFGGLFLAAVGLCFFFRGWL